ncbi:MAG: hypothetical protein ACXAC8_15950 [Candidatus Hodarchaeales archaeon]|jgi:DNA-binding Lrp family transcriptional regulator
MVGKGAKLAQESLAEIRQNKDSYKIDDFSLEFLSIWEIIHQQAPKMTLSDIKEFTQSILESITLPFYQKFKNLKYIEKYDSWVKSLSSIVINWPDRGRIMFPLRLIIYEIVNHEENLFNYYLKRVQTGEIICNADNLFNILFPKLINVSIPLSEIDLLILKSFQVLQTDSTDIFKGAKLDDFSNHLDVSSRTILRRLQNIKFLQISIPMHFVDMAKLGYETFLTSHFNSIPNDLTSYVLYSVDLIISQFSVFQVPVSKTSIYMRIQDELEPMIFQNFNRRSHSWNLSGLMPGKDGWKIPPSFLYSEPSTKIITPSPAMDVSLKPDFNSFRKLSPADIKILEFITTTGALQNRKQLSNTVKVSLPEVSSRLDEYQKQNLLYKIHQFFNIGLDLSVSFCITCPSSYDISWIPQFLSFPKIDLFFNNEDQNSIYFGHVKLPPKWYKDFTRKVRRLKKTFKDLKFYYTVDAPDIAKWSVTLSDTYF